jgi:hypothetical protein
MISRKLEGCKKNIYKDRERYYNNATTAPNRANIPELTTNRPALFELEELPVVVPVLPATLLVAVFDPVTEPVAPLLDATGVPVG